MGSTSMKVQKSSIDGGPTDSGLDWDEYAEELALEAWDEGHWQAAS